MEKAEVAVLGAGVIGLACAKLLLEAGFSRVTVIAADWSAVGDGVTSDGAAAFWERRSDAHTRWASATLQHYHALIAAGQGDATVRQGSGSSLALHAQRHVHGGGVSMLPLYGDSTGERQRFVRNIYRLCG